VTFGSRAIQASIPAQPLRAAGDGPLENSKVSQLVTPSREILAPCSTSGLGHLRDELEATKLQVQWHHRTTLSVPIALAARLERGILSNWLTIDALLRVDVDFWLVVVGFMDRGFVEPELEGRV
jgi:hypothetical protein